MDFRAATDVLFQKVDHEDLARTLGVSVASVRQARLQSEAKANRLPPIGWESAVLKLAEQRISAYSDLVEKLATAERPRTRAKGDRTSRSERPHS